jgi:glycosyltransferase involved in cell wall biosynthesis
MHILLVANGYPPASNSGVETYTFQLANGLRHRGHDVKVFCRLTDFNRPDFELTDEHVHGVPVTRIVNDQKNIEAFSQTYRAPIAEEIFRNYLDQNHPDLIHYNHLIGLSCKFPILSNSLEIPSVITLHDFWPFCPRINLVDWMGRRCPGPDNGGDCLTCLSGGQSGWRSALLHQVKQSIPFRVRQMLRNKVLLQGSKSYILRMVREDFSLRQDICQEAYLSAKRVLAPSEYVRRAYISNGYPDNRIEVLPLGIEKPIESSSRLSDHKEDGVVFAFVGSLIPVKGVDLLIRAFRRLPDSKAGLLIYGNEELAPPDYRRLLKDLSRGDERIHFMGAFSQEERSSVYWGIDVLVLPSRFPETFSLASREALAHGRPVIAAEVGALAELVQPGINGAFFPPDDENELLDRLQDFASNPSRLKIMQNQPQVPILSVDEHVAAIEQIYRDIVSN